MSQLLQYYKVFQQQQEKPVNTTPTIEDLTIDDNLSLIDRVVRYVKSSIGLQRLVHTKMISDVAVEVGLERTKESLIPLLADLSVDPEPAVRQRLVEQLSPLAQFHIDEGSEDAYRVILDSLLPITSQLLEDEKLEVRQSASSTLVNIAKLIRPDDLGPSVLTIVLRLAHEDDKEEMRMTAAELLNLLAECFGSDLCKQFIIPEVVSLAEDPVFRVRKSTALNFHNICHVGGEHELFERLMPAYVRLSKDDMYRVRRACADSLAEVSKYVSNDIRVGVLVEIFLRLAQDHSRLVKQSVLQQSGMFIATLPSKAVTDVILGYYCSTAVGPTGDMSIDAELRYWCAYNFPAVLQTLGASRWDELKEVYHTLIQSRTASVKQTLAPSLHAVAKILGEKLVEEELISVFEDMIQDAEIVQIGVIRHLADFLRLLPEPCRVSYLPLLQDILNSTNAFNWRLRQSLAQQLPDLVMLPPPHLLYSTLFPLIMILLQDPVASVRNETFKGISTLLCVLNSLPSETVANGVPSQTSLKFIETVANTINELVSSTNFQNRIIWLELTRQFLIDLPRDLFEQYFLSGILVLTLDRVSNIRVAVADLIAGWAPDFSDPWLGDNEDTLHPWKWFLARIDVQECVKRLHVDDADVFLRIKKLSPLFPELEFKSISCRGLKQSPGGIDPIPFATTVPIKVEGALPLNDVASANESDSCISPILTDEPEADNSPILIDTTASSNPDSLVFSDVIISTISENISAMAGGCLDETKIEFVQSEIENS